MSYIKFAKDQLINLEFSLTREILRSNRAGAYASQTLAGCNTRKYHGLLICPQPGIDDDNHVLLSNLDETVIQNDAEFNFGIRRYKDGIYNPKGHKYLREFGIQPVPFITYRVGGVILSKEMVFAMNEDRILIRYTLLDAHSPTILRLRPFLAFRNVHFLTHANLDADTSAQSVPGGIRCKMYHGYTPLFMQISKQAVYTHVPDWYYNVEYQKEIDRGYEPCEDLFSPGYFEIPIKKGESIVFSAGTSETDISRLSRRFGEETKRRLPRDNYLNCLRNAAQQFIVNRDGKAQVIAGFPYFGRFSRDTFIALPGLTLANGNPGLCKEVLDTVVHELNGPLFPNILTPKAPVYNSADAPLWFIWAVQNYAAHTGKAKTTWTHYKPYILQILEGYRKGTLYNIHMQDNGLIYAGQFGQALTWMDAIIDGNPVTPRMGCPVEVNALWYNALCYVLENAKREKNLALKNEWEEIASTCGHSFIDTFWSSDKGYLADCVDGDSKDWTLRPNQVIAAAMPYTPLPEEIRKSLLSRVKRELLTPFGLRTLSPTHSDYHGVYYGNQMARDLAYHQGTAFPWLLGFFAEAYLNIHGKSGLSFIKNIFYGFEQEMTEHGLGSISEVYDGDPPHKPGGAISQAWSVSELLRIHELINTFEKQ